MTSLGELTTRALRGAWRTTPPRPQLTSAELRLVAPHLIGRGFGGLGWWAIRNHPELADTAAGQALHDAWATHVLHDGLAARGLERVLDVAAAQRLEAPLLAKGWAQARSYPSPGQRPYGDVDLLIDAGARGPLKQALAQRPVDQDWIDVDLDHQFWTYDATPLRRLRERARAVMVGERALLVLGPEDALRFNAIHAMLHGGWHAVSLADVALSVEQRPHDFDWELALSSGTRRHWVTNAIALAAGLLGADLRGTPVEHATVPAWVRGHALRGLGATRRSRAPHTGLAGTTTLRAAVAQLRARRTDPVVESLRLGRSLGNRQPRHLSAVEAGRRAAVFAVDRLVSRPR